MIEPLLIALAFAAGLLFKRLGMPPLLGYLLAGFAAAELGLGNAELINIIADFAIVLLLFTIGLKLNAGDLLSPHVWAVASLHTAIVVPTIAVILFFIPTLTMALPEVSAGSAAVLALALSFSSTVFAVKIFEDRGEVASLHAQVAIGILIIQDLFAVAYLLFSMGKFPSPWAVAILLALPLLRLALVRMLRLAGHGELLILFGITVALCSAQLFELVNLKGGLGALVFGVLLSKHGKSVELYKSLMGFKDIFLTAFFLSVGYYGMPSGAMLLVAVVLTALIVMRPLIYFSLMLLFRLRARTAFLASLSLTNYSEFGLIVAAIAVQIGALSPQWLTTLAVAMALSLFVAAPANAYAHRWYIRYADYFQRFERQNLITQERSVDLGEADVLVFGMGRIGAGAYEYLIKENVQQIIGVDESSEKVLKLQAEGVRCVHGDVSDGEFLRRAHLQRRKLILVSLSKHEENVDVVNLLRQLHYTGRISVICHFPDQARELQEMGCTTFNLYAEAGHGFAERAMETVVSS